MRNECNNWYRALLEHSSYLSLFLFLLMRSVINWDRKLGREIEKLSNKYAIYCLFFYIFMSILANLTFGFVHVISSYKDFFVVFVHVFRIPTFKSGLTLVIKPVKN